MKRPYFALVVLCGVVACASPTSSPTGESAEDLALAQVDAYSLTMTQGDSTIVSIVSSLGTTTTQSRAGASAPEHRALLRNRDGLVSTFDATTNVQSTKTLAQTIQAKVDERKSAMTPPPTGSSALAAPPAPLRTFQSLHTAAVIAGTAAHAFEMDIGDVALRLWYADSLPQPSGAMRDQLLRLSIGDRACGPSAVPENAADVPAQPSGDAGADPSCDVARLVAGRVLLRAESRVGSSWVTVSDTTDVRRIRTPARTFDPPGSTGDLPPTPVAALATAPDASVRSTSAPTAVPLAAPGDTTATVRNFGGTVLKNPKLYTFYWGATFSDASHKEAITELNSAAFGYIQNEYSAGLTQYGVHQGETKSVYYDSDNPPGAIGGNAALSFARATIFVNEKSLTTSAPAVWWKGGDAPIYVIYVPEAVVDTSDWGGYHAAAPMAAANAIPFPISLAVHDVMPYMVVKVPESTMTLPTGGPSYRATCASASTPFCQNVRTALGGFDIATRVASHEYVETTTDPVFLTGWADLTKFPPWDKAEIGDICEDNPTPWGAHTLVHGIAVATYWSNAANACIPESRPEVTIVDPTDNSTIPWTAGGVRIGLRARASDPSDGDMTAIDWNVDGKGTFATGETATSPTLSLGTHLITATVHDTQGLTANDTVFVTVAARPPVMSIATPVAGATVGSQTLITFRGEAVDPQDGLLPESSLVWRVNGTTIGSGRLVSHRIGTLGDAVVTLTATDSAGISASATSTIHVIAGDATPSVAILSPKSFTNFSHSTDVVPFKAAALDSAGAPVPEASIRWTDDIDGFLGTGSTLGHTLSGSSCGLTYHHVTVTVTDAAGHTVSDTITVLIGVVC